jgi:hypothetical protein
MSRAEIWLLILGSAAAVFAFAFVPRQYTHLVIFAALLVLVAVRLRQAFS